MASYALVEPCSEKGRVGNVKKDGGMWKSGKSGLESLGRHLTSLSSALSQPSIWRPLLFFLLHNALVPSCSQAMFFFSTDVLHFSKEFLSAQGLIGYAFLLIGTTIYSRYVAGAGYSFSQIFVYCQLATLGLCLLDVLLVSRVSSTYLGLPDRVFVLGTDVFGTVLSRMSSQPFFLIAARLCPPGCEATLYALFMSTSNFGHTLSGMFGAFVTPMFGVEQGQYEGLTGLLLLRAFCTMLPLALIAPLLKGVNQLKDD